MFYISIISFNCVECTHNIVETINYQRIRKRANIYASIVTQPIKEV